MINVDYFYRARQHSGDRKCAHIIRWLTSTRTALCLGMTSKSSLLGSPSLDTCHRKKLTNSQMHYGWDLFRQIVIKKTMIEVQQSYVYSHYDETNRCMICKIHHGELCFMELSLNKSIFHQIYEWLLKTKTALICGFPGQHVWEEEWGASGDPYVFIGQEQFLAQMEHVVNTKSLRKRVASPLPYFFSVRLFIIILIVPLTWKYYICFYIKNVC